jgi:hypothetical protein
MERPRPVERPVEPSAAALGEEIGRATKRAEVQKLASTHDEHDE